MSTLVPDNPFSTRFTRPGEIPYLFANIEKLSSLVRSFAHNRWLGQIVGPHGCGKTTLCHQIADELREVFGVVDHVTIRSGSDIHALRFKQASARSVSAGLEPKLTIVDGVERLSLLQQWMMVAHLSGKKASRSNSNSHSDFDRDVDSDALLITSHRQLKFIPVLHSIKPSLATFSAVAKHLDSTLTLDEAEFSELFEQAGRDTREALMLLYDRHESRRV